MAVIIDCDLWQTPEYLIREFGRFWYARANRGQMACHWRGVLAAKCPLDLWVYQEILFETQPDVIIESGTHLGGTALFLADVCNLINRGRVISIDIAQPPNPPRHDRLSYIYGSSVSPEVVNQFAAIIQPNERVMVILDSDHKMEHVLAELRTYGSFVSPGCYIIVEDSNLNGHPVFPEHGPGPMEAIAAFLKETIAFEVDRHRERFLMTYNPMGYLRKVT